MALDYYVYYTQSKDELQSMLDRFIELEGVAAFFFHYSTRETNALKIEILNEMGYESHFQSYASMRLNKWKSVEATNALKIFRDKYLGVDNSLFLLENESELPSKSDWQSM